jgi:hypothetical protein
MAGEQVRKEQGASHGIGPEDVHETLAGVPSRACPSFHGATWGLPTRLVTKSRQRGCSVKAQLLLAERRAFYLSFTMITRRGCTWWRSVLFALRRG